MSVWVKSNAWQYKRQQLMELNQYKTDSLWYKIRCFTAHTTSNPTVWSSSPIAGGERSAYDIDIALCLVHASLSCNSRVKADSRMWRNEDPGALVQ